MGKGGKVVLWSIAGLAVVVRFLWLGRIPGGVSHDDLVYIMSGKTLWLFGKDLAGTGLIQLLFGSGTEGVISPIPAVLLAPFYGIVNLNLFTARLPYLFLNIFTALGLFVLVKKIFGDYKFAVVTGMIFLFNPWSIFLARLTTDTAFALFFFVWGMAMLISFSGKKLFWAGLFFGLGFFSYHGAKLLAVPIIFVGLWYRTYLVKTLNIRQAGYFLGFIMTLILGYFAGQGYLPGSVVSSRSQEIVVLNKDLLAAIVNDDRRLSIDNGFKNLVANKAMAGVNEVLKNYAQVFSGAVFFASGDPTPINNFARHGLFYAVDAIFLVIGLFCLNKKNRKGFLLFMGLTLTAPIASAVHIGEVSIVNRGFMLLPVFCVFIGAGVVWMAKKLPVFILGLVMFLSLGNFLYYYFFVHPILSQESFFVSERVAANYYVRARNTAKITVVNNSPRGVFLETAFYLPVREQNVVWKDNFERYVDGGFRYGNFEITNTCPDKFEDDTTYVVKSSFEKCGEDRKADMVISDRHYGGAIYKIYNDKICAESKPEKWLRFFYINDYDMEEMETGYFCRRWMAEEN